MAGAVTFRDSLEARLALAAPARDDLARFAGRLSEYWTPGAPELLEELSGQGHAVWIVSGAPVELLRDAARALAVPADQVRGVRLDWTESGAFRRITPDDPFSVSKTEGLRGQTEAWGRPRVMVGDGSTDRAVYDAGLVDHFIAFTEHARRPEVLGGDTMEADSMDRLRHILRDLL